MQKPNYVQFYGKRPFILAGAALFLLTGSLGIASRRARPAQQQPPAQTALPKDVQDLMLEFDDIGELRTITPLKLTPEQIDKIVVYVGEGQAEYNKKNADLLAKTIRDVAGTIKQAKKEALQGKPAQGEEQVAKAMTAMLSKRSSLEVGIMTTMSDKVMAVLTPKQQEAMAKVAREYQGKKEGKDNVSVAQYCKLYIYRVFAGYARSTTVLKELKAEIEGVQQ